MLVALAGAVLLRSALAVRRDLEGGRRAVNEGRRLLFTGHPDSALAAFERAEESFDRAAAASKDGALGVAARVPILGRTPSTIFDLARASRLVAQAGQVMARAVGDLPGGIGALAPSRGRIPIERFAPLAAAVDRAHAATSIALDVVQAAPTSLVPGPVAHARWQAEEELASAEADLESGRLILEGLPGFLGSGEKRTYFFGAANPAELRGSLGVIGAYSILTIDDGAFHFSRFRPTNTLPDYKPDEVTAPGEEFARNYDQFGGAGFWKNISMSPHFPSVAKAIETSYGKATGADLDGVIIADPMALQALLRVTGPQEVTGLPGATVDEDNVVDFIANEAYAEFPNAATRKEVLGAVAATVFDRFLSRAGSTASVRALAKTAGEGHIQAYSDVGPMEQGLLGTAVGGAFTAAPGDFLSVIQNNGAGSKVDFYQDRSVSYAVRLLDDGRAEATAEVTLVNNAPSSGETPYVIGPFPGVPARAGENVAIVNLYCADRCALVRALRDGSDDRPSYGTELGHPFYQEYFKIPSKETARLSYTLQLAGVWQGNSSGGTYSLTFENQTTIRPTRLTVAILAPTGMHVTSTSVPMRVEGGLAVWRGVPTGRLEIEVAFQPSMPLRLWRDLDRLLSRPIIDI